MLLNLTASVRQGGLVRFAPELALVWLQLRHHLHLLDCGEVWL